MLGEMQGNIEGKKEDKENRRRDGEEQAKVGRRGKWVKGKAGKGIEERKRRLSEGHFLPPFYFIFPQNLINMYYFEFNF